VATARTRHSITERRKGEKDRGRKRDELDWYPTAGDDRHDGETDAEETAMGHRHSKRSQTRVAYLADPVLP
jgi:hypothetical protein